MMKIISIILVLILLLTMQYSHAFELPDDALQLIATTTVDPCSICIEQSLKKAFNIMNDKFSPGLVIKNDDNCRLVKAGSNEDNEMSLTCYPSDTLIKSLKEGEQLPQIIFTFYTSQKRLVGISENDFTSKDILDLYNASQPGTIFEGTIRLIAFKYGDGPTYNYFKQSNKLQIHCIVLDLKPVVIEKKTVIQ